MAFFKIGKLFRRKAIAGNYFAMVNSSSLFHHAMYHIISLITMISADKSIDFCFVPTLQYQSVPP